MIMAIKDLMFMAMGILVHTMDVGMIMHMGMLMVMYHFAVPMRMAMGMCVLMGMLQRNGIFDQQHSSYHHK